MQYIIYTFWPSQQLQNNYNNNYYYYYYHYYNYNYYYYYYYCHKHNQLKSVFNKGILSNILKD